MRFRPRPTDIRSPRVQAVAFRSRCEMACRDLQGWVARSEDQRSRNRMFGLLSLGFTLSLDNFRSSLVLGGLKPTFTQSVKTSAIFGAWDGIAPLVGIIVGSLISDKVSGTADTIAIIGLGAYGLLLIGRAVTTPERADPDLRWARFGLPIPLSVDNIAGGAALGLAGYSPWLAPVLFAVITFGM